MLGRVCGSSETIGRCDSDRELYEFSSLCSQWIEAIRPKLSTHKLLLETLSV